MKPTRAIFRHSALALGIITLISASSCTQRATTLVENNLSGTNRGSDIESILIESKPSIWSEQDEQAVENLLITNSYVSKLNSRIGERYSLDELSEIHQNRVTDDLKDTGIQYSDIDLFIEALGDIRALNDSRLLTDAERIRLSILVARAYDKQDSELFEIAASDFAMLIRKKMIQHKRNGLSELESLRETVKEIFKLTDDETKIILELGV